MGAASGFGRIARAAQADAARATDDAVVRRALNAIGVTGSIMEALVDHPGLSGAPEDMVKAARTMLDASCKAAADIMNILGLAENQAPWIYHQALRAATFVVSRQWRTRTQSGQHSADVSAYLPAWIEVMNTEIAQREFPPDAPDDEIAVKVAMLDAMSQIMPEMAIFNFFRDENENMHAACAAVFDAVMTSAQSLSPANASDESRRLLLAALIRNAGSLYAAAWRNHAREIVDELMAMDTKTQNAYIRSKLGGFPIAPVEQTFRSNFARLADMVRHIATPAAKKIAAKAAESTLTA